jgi:hypothetical protein
MSLTADAVEYHSTSATPTDPTPQVPAARRAASAKELDR